MTDKIIKILKSVKEATGIDTAAYNRDGTLLYRTSSAPSNDFSISLNEKDIVQPKGERVTVLPLSGGITAVLNGTGEEFLNYAALIRTAVESTATLRELSLEEKLRLYLIGELDSELSRELASKYGKPFDAYVLTLISDTPNKTDELKNFLEAVSGDGDLIVQYDDNSVAFIKKCGGEDEYQSATDFAFTMYDSIKEELRIDFVINVGGTVHSFGDLGAYFQRCGLAYSFGRMMAPNDKIYSYKEYIMIKMLSDIPLESLSRYLDTLLDRDSAEILEDSELMGTADEFFKNSLNISETSRSMYMHRNTLIYRLDKIEKATGLNLRHFNDALAFRLLTVLDKLVRNKNRK